MIVLHSYRSPRLYFLAYVTKYSTSAQSASSTFLQIIQDYYTMMALPCDDMFDVEFTFNSLQASSSYDATS